MSWLEQNNPKSNVPQRYRKIWLIPFQYQCIGSKLNLANKFTKNTISGLVLWGKYNITLVALKYGTSGPSISSSSFLEWNGSFWGSRDWTQ